MYRKILVPVDLEHPSGASEALATAESLANCFSSWITICTVVRDARVLQSGDWLPLSYEQRLFEARSKLDAFAADVADDLELDLEVGTGTICGGILEVAQRVSADLIVLSSHPSGLGDYVHWANAARVARRADCSVLIVRAWAPVAKPAEPALRANETSAMDQLDAS